MKPTIRSVANDPPPEGVVVETLSRGGLLQPLERYGDCWFGPDGLEHMYSVPVLWAYVEAEA